MQPAGLRGVMEALRSRAAGTAEPVLGRRKSSDERASEASVGVCFALDAECD